MTINLEDFQNAALFVHKFEPVDGEEGVDLEAAWQFSIAYSHAFGLHPQSVAEGMRLGWLAERSSREEISFEEDTEVVDVPDRPTEDEFDDLPKLDLSKALKGVEEDEPGAA
jgi:hypothetical protein